MWTRAARASVKTTARLTYLPLLAHNTHTKQVRDTDRGRQKKKKVMPSVLDQLKPAAQFSLNKSFYSYCQRTSLEIRCFSKQTEKN